MDVFGRISHGEFDELEDTTDLDIFLPLLTRVLTGSNSTCTILTSRPQTNQLQNYLAGIQQMSEFPEKTADISFELGTTEDRVIIVVSEVKKVYSQLQQVSIDANTLGAEVYTKEVQAILSLVLAIHPHWLTSKEIVLSLLHIPNGHDILLGIVLNDAFRFDEMLQLIVSSMAEATVRQAQITSQGQQVLMALCRTSLTFANKIRKYLTEQQQFPAIVLEISFYITNDLVVYLCSIMNDSWIWSHINVSCTANSDVSNKIRADLLEKLEKAIDTKKGCLTLLRCYCGLMGISHLAIRGNEFTKLIQCAMILSSFENQPDAIVMGFCVVLLACTLRSEVLTKSKDGSMATVDACVKALFSNNSARSLFLYMSLLLHTSQGNAAILFVKQLLNAPISIASEPLNKFGDCLLKQIFTESVMSRELLAIPPVQSLNAKVECIDHLTIRCMYVLLCEKSFVRYRIDPHEWILAQLNQCSTPLHPLLPGVMLEFAECCCASYEVNVEKLGVDCSISKFSLVRVKHIMQKAQDNPDDFLKAALMLLFVLQFNQRARMYPNAATTTSYPIDTFPIQYILHHARDQTYIYPPLLRLVVEECPELCYLSNPSEDTISSSHSVRIPTDMREYDNDQCIPMMRALSNALPSAIAPVYSKLICHVLPKGIEQTAISEEIENLWNIIKGVHAQPYVLCMEMLVSLMQPSKDATMHRATFLQYNQVIDEPYSVLRCDERVFENAPLFRIALDILEFMLIASSSLIRHKLQIERNRRQIEPEAGPTSVELLKEKLLAQSCVSIHCLIEIAENTNTREIKTCIFKFVQRKFSENERLLRAVHDQGYSISMVVPLVYNVPILEDVFSFLLEIIAEKDEPPCFAYLANFCSELVKMYPENKNAHPISVALVACCVDRLFEKDKKKRRRVPINSQLILSVLGNLNTIAEVFPDLSSGILEIYFKAKRAMKSEDQTISALFSHLLEAVIS